MQRLKTRSQFQAVLAGSTVARTAHFALHCVPLDAPHIGHEAAIGSAASSLPLFAAKGSWLGAMVPKRWAKRAVTRNAIKRQIYSVSADFDTVLPMAAHVVRLRTGFSSPGFVSATSDLLKTAVRQELLQLFERAVASLTPRVVQIELA